MKGIFIDSEVPSPFSKGPRWTLAHGFFLQMGGFVLSDRGSPIHILLDGTWSTTRKERHLIYNIQQNIIDAPRITEEEIQDRGKGDVFSKIFIIVQTTWFVVQCLARWASQLPVSELEVVTLGFAILNGTTYALWWHKPQNVTRPVFIEQKTPHDLSESSETPAILTNTTTANDSIEPELQAPNIENKPSNPFRKPKSWVRKELEAAFRRSSSIYTLLPELGVTLFMAFIRPMAKLMGNEEIAEDRIPMFYASATNESTRRPTNIVLVGVVGSMFGLMHVIPSWFILFSSHRAMMTCRVCAIIITIAPLTLGVAAYEDFKPGSPFALLRALFMVSISIYPIARIIILVSAITSLHSLAPATLQTIEWTTFIPHL
ncbi:hypothetical protein BDN70DRAFT_899629 [Pholiota conissans]|uniref:Uncharacterized protein n=1 Tax=Pholiota conissans TaxID=109636 RepID=A0A9P5YPQ4_9AGAR|nr:hypothetical protein BDN70DRAFT_899629 [Pholiota conissans]